MQSATFDLKMQIETLDARTFTDADAHAIGELLAIVWPHPEKSVEFRVQQMLAMGQGYTGSVEQAPRSFVIREEGTLLAHAAIVPANHWHDRWGNDHRRTGPRLCKSRTPWPWLRRADCKSGTRNRRRRTVLLRSVSKPRQQSCPFYEKLGACVIENAIINSLAENPKESPFKDSVIMRYPSSGEWPEGEIDLRGPGY